MREQRLGLHVTQAAKEWLAEVGYDPAYGARPLRRAIQQYLQNALAKLLLSGDAADGTSVVVDAGDAGLTFAVQQPTPAVAAGA